MPRQANFDVAAFEQKILDTILDSPVVQSRREIFNRCGFNNSNKAYLSAFDRFIKRETTQALVDCHGDKKNRVYIARVLDGQESTELISTQSILSIPSPTEAQPVQNLNPLIPSDEPVPVAVHRERPPQPTFTVQAISDASEVTGALQTLSDASGDAGLVALGVNTREPEKDSAFLAMTYQYNSQFPMKRMVLAAGDIVYDFDIPKILKSVYATSDNNNIKGFAPYRDFFANHTVVAHDALTVCEPLIALDIPPRALKETRLAVRMLQAKAGVSFDDSLEAGVARYLRQTPYDAGIAIVWTLIPLFHELRVQLGDECTTFDSYCQMLPQLAHIQGEELTATLDVDEDVIDNDHVPSNEAVKITYEVMGNGEVKMTPDLSLLTHAEKQSFFNGRTLLTVKFSSKPKMFDLLPALYDANLHPVVLLSDELVLNVDDDTPEDGALHLMRTVSGVTGFDMSLRMVRSWNWRKNDWKSPGIYHIPPDGWQSKWWSEWVDLSDVEVQSVLNF